MFYVSKKLGNECKEYRHGHLFSTTSGSLLELTGVRWTAWPGRAGLFRIRRDGLGDAYTNLTFHVTRRIFMDTVVSSITCVGCGALHLRDCSTSTLETLSNTRYSTARGTAGSIALDGQWKLLPEGGTSPSVTSRICCAAPRTSTSLVRGWPFYIGSN